MSQIEKDDLKNFKEKISVAYADIQLPTKDSKYTKVTELGKLTAYPSTTKEVADSIIIIKNATLHGDSKERINIVALQGTEMVDGQATGIQEDLLAGLELNNHYLYDAYQAILKHIPQDSNEKLLITGVSLGGMVSQQLAGLDIIKAKYDVKYVVALGSPMLTPEKIDYEKTSVVRICDAADLVPHLSESATKDDLEKNITIERQSQYKSVIGAHALSYVDEEIWKNIDVLGHENGKAYITFEDSNFEIVTEAAENLDANKEQ